MLLSSLLDPELILTKVKAASLDDIIRELLETMYRHGSFDHPFDEVLAAVKEREALGGTVLPTGIAIPHARIDLFSDILIAIAPLKTPIERGGVEVRLVVLILTGRTTSNLYLNSLAAFARLSQNAALMDSLLAAASAQDVVETIQQAAIEVRKELTVEHIMERRVASVSPETSVRGIIDLCVEHHVGYIPVVDENGCLVGECSSLDILQLGLPNYAQLLGNIQFMKTFEPMEELLDKEDTISAAEIMEQPTYSFQTSTSLVAAAATFAKSRRTWIPVLNGRTLVGLVSQLDILTKVLRG